MTIEDIENETKQWQREHVVTLYKNIKTCSNPTDLSNHG